MTDKKLEEAASDSSNSQETQTDGNDYENEVTDFLGQQKVFQAFVAGHRHGFLRGAKWYAQNPTLCEWCDRPEIEEFWHGHNGQTICKECYDHHTG